MSLQSLRDLRMAGRRPDRVICVVVGPVAKWRIDAPDLVLVPTDAHARLMDWRPVVGLWVALFATVDAPAVVLDVMESLKTAGAKFYGAALPSGIYPCIAEPTPAHHKNLRSRWEALCPK